MTVAELIKALKAMPQEAVAVVSGFMNAAEEVEEVRERGVTLYIDQRPHLFADDPLEAQPAADKVVPGVFIGARTYRPGRGR